MDFEYVPCNLCGGTNNRLLFQKRGLAVKEIFSIVQCTQCALIFVNPRLKKEALMKMYDEQYFKGQGFGEANYLKWAGTQEKKQEAEAHLAHLSSFLHLSKSPTRLLEVGFGTGDFLLQGKSQGFIVEGTDISPFACKSLAEKGVKVYQGFLEEVPLLSGFYDCVVAIETMEHLPDPKAFLLEVKRILKPGGLFYHQTANFTRHKWRGASSGYVMPEGHLYYFTYETFKRSLTTTGFDVLDSYRYYHPGRRPLKLLFEWGFLKKQDHSPRHNLDRLFYSLFRFSDLVRGNWTLPLGQKREL